MGKKEVYHGVWDEQEEMLKDFEINESELDGCNILFAFYGFESYEGSAFVFYEKGGKLYEVNGSHCSCYGLEDQWSPEETTWEALRHILDKGSKFYILDDDKDALGVLMELVEGKLPAK